MNPQVSLEAGAAIHSKAGFWRRQFDEPPTPAQTIFDVIFGIAMPVLCFLLDPGIIKGQGDLPFVAFSLSHYSPFIYSLTALAIPTLGLWLGIGKRTRALGALISGVLLAGAMCSFFIGVAILPLSALALMAVIGALGFTPLVTGLVYLRNAIRSNSWSRVHATRSRTLRALVLGFTIAVAAPGLANWEASRLVTLSMDEILQGDAVSIEAAVHRIRYLQWYANPDPIVFAYKGETDPNRKERLAKAYEKMTGEDIEDRLYRQRD
jgi:hypothetical protein